MMTLHKLKIFRVVVDAGSLNKAARALYLVQSVVSQHVADLEADLGTALLQRTSRGIAPTAAGKTLYDYAGRILALVTEAELAIAHVDAQTSLTISIAATPGVSVYLLPQWLQNFRTHHPNVGINLQTALTHEVTRDLLKGRYDLAFIEGDLEDLESADIGRTKLQTVEYFVVVNALSELNDRRSLHIDDLESVPFVTRQPGSRARRWIDRQMGSDAGKLRIIAELDSPGAIKYAVLNGMGAGILPDYAIEREIERGELIALRLDAHPLTRPLLMLWDRRQPLSAIQRAFIRTLPGSPSEGVGY